MKVLVIGSGGREHALAWKLSQSPEVKEVYVAPGNGGTEKYHNVDIQAGDLQGLKNFALDKGIDLTVVGPENPLCDGIVDVFKSAGLKIFGPDKACAMFEKSKEFTKEFLEKYKIPTAKYKSYTDYDGAREGIRELSDPVVVKADGLCAGKGVIICGDEKEAEKALREIFLDKVFGAEGSTVVVEEFLRGRESSLLAFVSNNKIFPLEEAEDHKQIFDGDRGPNTGGVGTYSPRRGSSEKLKAHTKEILTKIEGGLKSEGLTYNGILFIGFMIENDEPKVVEFNVRFGDPETEVLMPRLKGDLYQILNKCIDGTLSAGDIEWREELCLCTILCSEGYPGSYEKGKEITGIENLDEDIILFHNGTKREGQKLLTNGGRVLTVATLSKDMERARAKVYANIDKLHFDGMYYRKDIGLRK